MPRASRRAAYGQHAVMRLRCACAATRQNARRARRARPHHHPHHPFRERARSRNCRLCQPPCRQTRACQGASATCGAANLRRPAQRAHRRHHRPRDAAQPPQARPCRLQRRRPRNTTPLPARRNGAGRHTRQLRHDRCTVSKRVHQPPALLGFLESWWQHASQEAAPQPT